MKYVYFGPLRKVSSKGLENSYLKQPMSKIKDRGLFWFLVLRGYWVWSPGPFARSHTKLHPLTSTNSSEGWLSLSLGLRFYLNANICTHINPGKVLHYLSGIT